ncbi:MAG TPA: hypothetical protein PK331_15185, partial [Gordonia sp. (in: high G+C Gram-positive bacteria)]|nr:hypothetical protein [Gordonia sp. (in: high G+C Gram-positive bacteria)]
LLDAVLPQLLAQRSGHLSLVSSVSGYRGLPKALAYGPTKAALINLAARSGRRLRVEYVNSHGKASHHVVKVALVRAGKVIASEIGSGDEVELSVHRITTVELLD